MPEVRLDLGLQGRKQYYTSCPNCYKEVNIAKCKVE